MNVAKVQAFVGHAANRYLRKQEQKQESTAPALATTGFQYQPRSPAQWHARAHQSSKKFGMAPEPACAVVEPVNEALEVATPAPVPCAQQKVTQATLCVDCSHRRSNHCTGEPRLHTPEGSGAGFYCTTEHCDGQVLDQQGKCVACPCLAFRATASAPIKQKFPRADDYTPCGHCGHWKSHHCRVRKPSNAKNPKSRDWFGFQDADGKIAMCQHTLPGAEEYCCTSTSCAESTDGEHFCGCQKFLNPLERPRAAKPKAPRSAGAQPWRKCRLNFFNLETLL